MTTYRNIHGRSIQAVTTDPTGDITEGQVWYNTTSDTFKSVVAVESFSSSSPLATGRAQGSGAGTQTAGLFVGGRLGPPGDTTACENYNGTGWASIPSLNTARQYAGGCGTETSALTYGDYPATTTTEEFNGSAWSAQEGFSTARRSGASFGLETAAVLAGGSTGPAVTTATEEYNGEAWTGGGALSQARQYFAGTGIESAGLAFGGSSNPNTTIYTNTEEYDGSSWTSGGALPASRSMMFSWGTQTAGALSGGALPSTTNTCLKYDGSSWSSSPATMGTATKEGYSSGVGTSQSAGLTAGGDPGVARTEEFNISANVITAAAWSSGGSLGTGRYQSNGQNVGTKNAGLMVGGQGSYPPSSPAVTISNVEEYDGSSWSEVTNLPTTRAMVGTVGTQTAAFLFGGYGKPGGGPNPAPSSPNFDTTFNYDGSSWTSETAMPSAVAYLTGAGTQTAALSIGGYNASTTCNEYDGSSWTSGGSMTTGRHNGSAFGIQTAAVIAGGAPGVANDTEEYNGTSWTSAPDIPLNKEQGAVGGTQTSAILTLGNQPNPTTSVGYNGSTWFTQPSTSTARYGGSNGGTSLAGAYAAGGGGGPPTRQTTEEFTAETTALNVKTLTQS